MSVFAGAGAEERPGNGRRTIRLSTTLAALIGGLVLVAVAAVLAISWFASRTNTLQLLSDKAVLAIELTEARLRHTLDPVRDQLGVIAGMIDSGEVALADRDRLRDLMTGAIAATPQVVTISYVDPEGRLFGVSRVGASIAPHDVDGSADPAIREALAETAERSSAYWGDILYIDQRQHSALNLRQPLRVGGRFAGMLMAVVTVRDLSERIQGQDALANGGVAFVLYGPGRVLAHPTMALALPLLSRATPLPGLDQVADPVLAALWQGDQTEEVEDEPRVQIRAVDTPDGEQLVLYRTVLGYGRLPFIVGLHLPRAAAAQEYDRLTRSGLAGLAVMALAVLAGILVGGKVARPIRRLADRTAAVGTFDFGDVEPLPGSMFTELDEQARGFNAMLNGLRWFETYVPKSLVKRLMAKPEDEEVMSIEREVTVVFTDIVGFTAGVEGLPAADAATFLNDHFALLAAEAEAEGGTIDKFIGDALMVFWGAPERQKDHAERACRAVLAMAAALAADNDRREADGRRRVRLRIGVHSGLVVVGNIGAPGRTNYTIVGDTVNIGQRLEQLGKELFPEAEVAILVSDDTASGLEPGFRLESQGIHAVRGRREEIEVFRLLGVAAEPCAGTGEEAGWPGLDVVAER